MLEIPSSAIPAEIRWLNWRGSWLLLAFIGALAIHVKESFYRIGTFDSFFSVQALVVLLPIIVIDGFTLFWAFRRNWRGQAPSFLSAWAWFLFCIVVSRLVITYVYVREPLTPMILGGLMLLCYGLYLTIFGSNAYKHTLPAVALIGLFATVAGRTVVDNLIVDLKIDWWILYVFIASLMFAILENLSRRGMFEKYLSFKTLLCLIPIEIIANAATFYGYRQAVPTFLFAWAVYTLFDVILRVPNNYLLKEPLKVVHMLGMMLVVSGTFLTYAGGAH